jgi:enamine deaminase RidA (YjgF/YER057c/UK114 family)
MKAVSRVHWPTALVLLLGSGLALPAEPLAGDTPAATPPKKIYHLGEWERDIGYAQAVEAAPYLFVSGTVGRGAADDPEGWLSALRAAYERIGVTLAAHGIGFDHVVKETIYTRDIERLKAASGVRFDYYSKDSLPASTWVQIDRLFEADYLVEIEVTAILAPRGSPDRK